MAITDHADGRVTLIGTRLTGLTGAHPCVDLPDDRMDDTFDGVDGDASRPPALHYAPIDHDGIRRRVAAMTAWIATSKPALMVVDVSCEIAMLARLASVPVVYVRLSGLRNDGPHEQAFRAATMLLAPFAEVLDDPAVPKWVRAKTRYFPGLVTQLDARTWSQPVEPRSVVVVIGQGGAEGDGAAWAQAARATADRTWTIIGPCTPVADEPGNLQILGWVDDADARIARAGVVIGSAGDGVVGTVLAAGRPFLCLPEDRPFGEQRAKAARLVAAGVAVMGDNSLNNDWPALIATAERLDPAAARELQDANGAARAAAYLCALADRGGRS